MLLTDIERSYDRMQDMWLPFLTVLGLGIVELWLAIPVGFLLGLNPVLIAIASITGGTIGVLVTYQIAEHLRGWIIKRFFSTVEEKPKSRLYRIWLRYGVIGLGLLAPFLTGAPVGVVFGVAFNAPRKKLLFWILTGVVLWGTGLTLAARLGVLVFEFVVRLFNTTGISGFMVYP